MRKSIRHHAKRNPMIFPPTMRQESTMTEGQIQMVMASAAKLNQTTEHLLDTIAETVKKKLATIVADEEYTHARPIRIKVYMPIMCTPFCFENDNEQVIHISTPIQFSPVHITSVDDEPVE